MQAVPKDPEAGSVCTEELYKIWSPVVADLQKIPARPEASVYKANLEKLTASRFEYFVKANYTPKKCVEFQLKVADLKARGMSEKGISEVTRQDQELLLHHQQDLAKQEALRVQLSQEVASERQRRAR